MFLKIQGVQSIIVKEKYSLMEKNKNYSVGQKIFDKFNIIKIMKIFENYLNKKKFFQRKSCKKL